MTKTDELTTRNVRNNTRTACLEVSQPNGNYTGRHAALFPKQDNINMNGIKKKKKDKKKGQKGRKKGGKKGNQWATVHLITVQQV